VTTPEKKPDFAASIETRTEVQAAIRRDHFPIHKKHNWPHGEDCVCKQWEKENDNSNNHNNEDPKLN